MGTSKPARAAKPSTPQAQPLPSSTLVLDNGGYTMKAGYAPSDSEPPSNPLSSCLSIPNALVKTRDNRVYMGSQLSTHVSDWNEAVFRRPVEKGYMVNWQAEKEIWEHSFFDIKTAKKEVSCSDPGDTTLVLTEAPNSMAALQKNADEIIMEEWGFGGYVRCVGGFYYPILSGGAYFQAGTTNHAADTSELWLIVLLWFRTVLKRLERCPSSIW